MMARTRQNQVEFIEMFKNSTCLWRTGEKSYHNRKKKDAAYQTLLDKMRELEPMATKECVLKKINNMRSSFRKELKKIRASQKSGAEEAYQPKLWYFEHLSFLKDPQAARKLRPLESDESENEVKDENTTDALEAEEGSSRISIQSSRSLADPHCSRSKKRRMEEGCLADVMAVLSKDEDELDLFGRLISTQLKSVDPSQCTFAQNIIIQVLFQAKLGILQRSSAVITPL